MEQAFVVNADMEFRSLIGRTGDSVGVSGVSGATENFFTSMETAFITIYARELGIGPPLQRAI